MSVAEVLTAVVPFISITSSCSSQLASIYSISIFWTQEPAKVSFAFSETIVICSQELDGVGIVVVEAGAGLNSFHLRISSQFVVVHMVSLSPIQYIILRHSIFHKATCS